MIPRDVVAREEIRAVLIEYVHCVDSGRLDRALELFATDAVMEPGDDPICRGRAEIRTCFEQVGHSLGLHLPGPLRVRHHVSSINIDLVSATEARTTAYFLTVTARGPEHAGRYRDTLRHDGQTWHITHRRLNLEGAMPGGWLDSQNRLTN